MSATTISVTVFACVFSGALLGMLLRTVLPSHHLSDASKDIMKLGTGLIATISALVLGLMISSAQNSFNAQRNEFTQLASNVIVLDRFLAHYGPEARESRDLLRAAVIRMIDQMSPADGSRPEAVEGTGKSEVLYDKLQALAPQNDAQRSIQAQALGLAVSIGQTRWLMFEQTDRSIPMPFLVVLVSWVAVIFITFGMYAPPNGTVVVILLVCALSISGAIFLILELDQPFAGWIKISAGPLRNALAQLGH